MSSQNRSIFVFGSNTAGRHGKGAALYALQNHGAVYGVGVGRTGDSYGIPTKTGDLRVLPLERISEEVEKFLVYAKSQPNLTFNITRIGCGYAGYSDSDIAPMFEKAPANCALPKEWTEMVTKIKKKTASKITALQVVAPWTTKHRPKVFEDLVGQTEIIDYLKGSLSTGRLPNALLFHGASGSGKTTIARIFARYLNCATRDACGVCESCKINIDSHPDITDTNSASDRGLADIEALIQKAKFRPRFNVRVFILDESHMLTPHAINAFLKPLEEPPKHTIYILCTTDPQKFPKTILTRCTHHEVSMPEPAQVEKRLHEIAKLEGVDFPEELYPAVSNASQGCMREAVTLLDKAATILAANTKVSPANLISKVIVGSSDSVAMHSANLLLAMYSKRPSKVARAVFECDQPMLHFIMQAMYFNDFMMSSMLKVKTKHSFFSPTNLKFKDVTRKAVPELKFATLLEVNRKLALVRDRLHTVSTKEHSTLLSILA